MTPLVQVRVARLLVFLAVLTSATYAHGQATTGEVAGRVQDAGGLPVPGANVTALNPDTGFTRSAVTAADGGYVVTLLPPGRYTISAELSGFRKAVREGVVVAVGGRPTVNLDLQVGSVTEVVQVSGAAPLVDTTRSDLGGVVTGDDIANLPTLNRTFANIAVMMPEARPAGGFDPTKTRVGNFAMNGGDGRQLDVNVDGGDNKDNVVGSLLQNFAYESIQEFQVLQHRWTAESGRAVGGVVNVISKSGTNQLKGSGLLHLPQRQPGGEGLLPGARRDQARVRALGVWRIDRRSDRPRQPVLLRSGRAVRRARRGDTDSIRCRSSRRSRLFPDPTRCGRFPLRTTTRS